MGPIPARRHSAREDFVNILQRKENSLEYFSFICNRLKFFRNFSTWSKYTHDFFHKLWKDGHAAEAGVSLLPALRITTEDVPYDVPWKDVVFGCTDVNKETLARLSAQHKRNYK